MSWGTELWVSLEIDLCFDDWLFQFYCVDMHYEETCQYWRQTIELRNNIIQLICQNRIWCSNFKSVKKYVDRVWSKKRTLKKLQFLTLYIEQSWGRIMTYNSSYLRFTNLIGTVCFQERSRKWVLHKVNESRNMCSSSSSLEKDKKNNYRQKERIINIGHLRYCGVAKILESSIEWDNWINLLGYLIKTMFSSKEGVLTIFF